MTPSLLWDAYKAVIRGKIIACTSLIKKQKKEKLGKLQLDLKELQRQHKNTLDNDKKIEIKILQNEIDAIYSDETQKKFIFLKQNYYEAGGKSTKWLAFKLRRQQADSTVYKIKHPKTGIIHNNIIEIQQSFETYYKDLYSQPELNNDNHIETFLSSLNLPKVTEQENNMLIKEITEKEIKAAITRLKPRKSPGTDGFTCEWYKAYREELTPRLKEVCNWVLRGGEVPPSWKEATITVIPKEGKDKLL